MDDPFPTDTGLFPTQGPWRAPETLGEETPDRRLRAWLACSGSLTRALRAACPEGFGLRIHRRFSILLPREEADLLRVPAGSPVLQREVWLLCRGQEVVFARSWIPEGALSDPGEYPLGDRLFEPGAGAERLRLEAAPVSAAEGSLWARRSLHQVGPGRLLVGEVFLPAMEALCPPPD
ncbi:chorismate--pyruvate lyase family protein [Thiohalorhabdus sp. Cl-TMA]|uniref:Chorismate lyase n=1 Tax=Thiohalorhabdus methylotrophus TaxID=3242694 RepID=A0ABV4TQ08_9GAMM